MYAALRSVVPAPVSQIARRLLGRRVRSDKLFISKVADRRGLEIGGPSAAFSDGGFLPLYRYVRSLDNCVFAEETFWGDRRTAGSAFNYCPGKAAGRNFIQDATDLGGIQSGTYDFVLASHVIEHIANPLKALREWIRILDQKGVIVAIFPHFRFTFDRRRTPTAIEHMESDYRNGTDEADLTHLEEVLALHDRSRGPQVGSAQQFRERSLRNFENRCLHHHVFQEQNSRELFRRAGLFVDAMELVKPHHLVLLASKVSDHV